MRDCVGDFLRVGLVVSDSVFACLAKHISSVFDIKKSEKSKVALCSKRTGNIFRVH